MSRARLALGPAGPELAFLSSLLPHDRPTAAPRGPALRGWHTLHDFLADLLSLLFLPVAPHGGWAVRGLLLLLHRGMSLLS